ncbi:hypothetical protein [Streptomyces sp. NPDC004286]|uniref:hypothetical protein n=1 Tax=Streptomyces sp. NPDC004286 TaxID=3364696 RepID=UPI00369FD037
MQTYAYTARLTDYDGSQRTRMLPAAEADSVIAAALWDEDKVAPDTDRSGRITITRTITGYRSATDTEPRTLRHTARLEPVCAPGKLTARQHDDLTMVQQREEYGGAVFDGGRVVVGFGELAPAAAARLLDRGWLAAHQDGTVTVSYAGRIAMALREHRTRTGYMGTDVWRVNALGEGGWEMGPGLYLSQCSCGHRDGHRYDWKSMAQRASRAHRLAHLRAVFDLTP